ncbi:MAG: glycoside hydrolase [Bacteroidales bacterium]|nr:glycoside hydrolase [Bacteroidales bacterium]
MKLSHFNYLLIPVIIIAGMAKTEIASGQKITDRTLWKEGTGKYNNYRIPSVIVTKKGTVLAFCEGREGGDSGDIDLLMKRSGDNGKTWSNEIVIWDDGKNTCGNPCVVEDDETGRILLILTWNNGKDNESDIIGKRSIDTRLPYICYSDDDGQTWSVPSKMPSACKEPSWGWYATGPGIGIQLSNGKHKGRLIIPANHSYDDPDSKSGIGPYGYGSHVLISDDHGKTWKMSRLIFPGCNESQVAELSDGSLIMNMRSYNNRKCRAVSFSSDGGETWAEIQHDPQLVESICQASILAYGDYKGKRMYLFANPAVTSGRTHMTVRVSFDDCKSWSNSRLIYPGPSAYSCLVKLKDRRVGVFFECGEKSPYETLRFISFQPQELFQQNVVIPEN